MANLPTKLWDRDMPGEKPDIVELTEDQAKILLDLLDPDGWTSTILRITYEDDDTLSIKRFEQFVERTHFTDNRTRIVQEKEA